MYYGIRENNARLDQLVGPYEYLGKKRVLFLNGIIANTHPVTGDYPHLTRQDAFNAPVVADSIICLNDMSEEPIWLIINCPGGLVDQGFILYDTIKTSVAPVYTVGRSCLSMGAIILSAGVKRYVFPSFQGMLHLPYGSASGDPKELEIRSKEINKIKDKIVSVLIDNGVKLSKKKLLQEIDKEKWLTAEEAVEYGLADEILYKGMSQLLKDK